MSETCSTAVSLNTDNLYEFNLDPLHLGIPLQRENNSKINYLDVWLDPLGSEISDNRRFQFDHRYFERPLYLFYINSMGGIDDMFFAGNTREIVDTKTNVVYKPQQIGDTIDYKHFSKKYLLI